jgi:hypothetical protein
MNSCASVNYVNATNPTLLHLLALLILNQVAVAVGAGGAEAIVEPRCCCCGSFFFDTMANG